MTMAWQQYLYSMENVHCVQAIQCIVLEMMSYMSTMYDGMLSVYCLSVVCYFTICIIDYGDKESAFDECFQEVFCYDGIL